MLLHFAERMAHVAVRKRSSDFIWAGLVSIAVLDARVELAHVLDLLHGLYQSALTLGGDVLALFDEASRLARPETALLLSQFPRRSQG
jgi:hypothetical protein